MSLELAEKLIRELVPILTTPVGGVARRKAIALVHDALRASEREGMQKAIEIARFRGAHGGEAILEGMRAAIRKL